LDYNNGVTDQKFSHLDADGKAQMVDVGAKQTTRRSAAAQAEIYLLPATIDLIKKGLVKKGDVFTVAELAGIMAAKQTGNLIPLCHPIMLEKINVSIRFTEADDGLIVRSEVHATDKTGVEMEALVAASVSALTIYDMVKAVDRAAVIKNIFVLEKKGGKSGDFTRTERP
jgi:cyclic pyranopterin monophosphate synthase